MLQKDLAALLGISASMVTRLVRRGMPTDTVERAEKWRRRHLETARMKGNRMEQTQRPRAGLVRPSRKPKTPAFVTDSVIEEMGDLVNGALQRGDHDRVAALTLELRELLRVAAPMARPRLHLRVWLALLVYMLHEGAAVRSAPDLGALLTPGEFGALAFPDAPWADSEVIYEAADHDKVSINGWPAEDLADED